MAHLAADGFTAHESAEVGGIEAEDVEALPGGARSGRLVRAFEVLPARPEAEQRARLIEYSRWLIEEATGG